MTKDIMISNLAEIIAKQSQEIDKLNSKNEELICACEEISLERSKLKEYVVTWVVEEAVKEFQNYLDKQEISMDKESDIDSFRHLLKMRISVNTNSEPNNKSI